MTYRDQILARIEFLRAELASLALLMQVADQPSLTERATPVVTAVTAPARPAPLEDALRPARAAGDLDGAAPRNGRPVPPTTRVSTPPAATAAPKRRGRKPGSVAKWSFRPGAAYRIVGENPFRTGNNKVLFDHLVSVHGRSAFTREALGRAISALRNDGVFNSEMDDHACAVAFVNLTGAKDRIVMASEVPVAAGRAPRKSRARTQVAPSAKPEEPAPPNRAAESKVQVRVKHR